MEYLNFDLQIGLLENGRYPVSVTSPAGEASDSFIFPYDEWQLRVKLKDLQLALRATPSLRRTQSPELQSVQDMGWDFFNSLLPGELRSRFDLSQRMASEQCKGLRVRLHIQDPKLGVLPWEYLYDRRQGEYLCLSTYMPIIRYVELPQLILPFEVTPPLRVLGMVCSPNNLPELDIYQEKRRVEEALAPLQQQGLLDLHWLEGGTWRDLLEEVDAAKSTGTGWHIFHFIGHGDFDETTEEGWVALVSENGRAQRLSATQLARLLADQRSLRLVVLNACEGATGSTHDTFSSTASILVRRGIATVVAMQYAISDPAAIELARTFYKCLAEGVPVDAALGEARKAISLEMPYSVEWGTPVLFMRAPDGVLFRVQPQNLPLSVAKKPTVPSFDDAQLNTVNQISRPEVPGKEPVTIPLQEKLPGNAVQKGILALGFLKQRLLLLFGVLGIILVAWGAFRLFSATIVINRTSPIDEMVMIYVPAGQFRMGALDTDSGAKKEDKPQHLVYLDAYWMDRTEVTNKQYAMCVKENYCAEPPDKYKSSNKHVSYYDNPDFATYPVVNVTWDNAAKYCNWAGRRLPTEAEWEKAARGVDGRIFPWGNQNPDCRLANSYNDVTSSDCAGGDTSAVGSHLDGKSPYGVMDMAGNVWEWVNDWWQPDYYTNSPASNPPGPAIGTSNYKVVRGSYWHGDWHELHTYYRYYSTPTSFSNRTGFRCAATAKK